MAAAEPNGDVPSKRPREDEACSATKPILISKEFNKNLAQLPETPKILKITLSKKSGGEEVGVIENKPGSTGSIRVYSYLLGMFAGEIDRQAAYLALAIYAEHTEDAHIHSGKHANIDRLLNVVSSGEALVGKIEEAQTE